MKNGHRFSILTSSLVAAVLILSLISGTAWAQNPTGVGGDPHLLKFENTGQLFQQAKGQLENALKHLNARDPKSKANLIEKAQDYLEKAIDHTVSYLEVLKSRAENPANQGIFPFNVSSNIDAHVTELENLRAKVQQDNNLSELRADNQELKDIYAGIRLETRYDYEILLNNNIGKFIGKADNVTTRLNAAIQNLNNGSKDTSTLMAIEANFTNLMQEASAEQQTTASLLAAPAGFDATGKVTNNTEALAFLKQVDDSQRGTIKTLREAAKQLEEFVGDYRRLSGGSSQGQRGNQDKERKILASGNSTLVASGRGNALIEGNVNVTLSGINGTLMVSNNANVITDGTNQTLGNNRVQYQGFTYAIITPPTADENMNIRVAISGNNINLTATCNPTATTCTAVLNGQGTVNASGVGNLTVSGEWSNERQDNMVTVNPPDARNSGHARKD